MNEITERAYEDIIAGHIYLQNIKETIDELFDRTRSLYTDDESDCSFLLMNLIGLSSITLNNLSTI